MDEIKLETWIHVVAIVATLITFALEFRRQRKVLKLTLFAEYTKRYQKIMLGFP